MGSRLGASSLLRTAQLLLTAYLVHPARGGEIQLAAVVKECPPKIHPSLQPHGRFGCPMAMDEETAGPEPVDWSPWTHPPECLVATSTSRSNATKYCLYTNSAHGHRGVSLITTPETAASAVEMLDDFNADFLRPLGSHVNVPRSKNGSIADGAGAGASASSYTDDDDRSYKVVDLPGKGKGVVATRRISRAEVVMVDFASIVIDLAFPSSVRRLDGYDLLDEAARQLADSERVLKLARRKEHPPNVVEDVMRTNAFHYELDEKPHMGLFADVARINHACKPNVYFQSSQSSLAARVIAFRDIQPGEEITLSYVDIGKTHEERQQALKRWGFTCSCDMCAVPASEIAASDARRNRIKALRGDIIKALSTSPGKEEKDLDGAIEMAEEVLSLVREEELRSLYAEQHDTLGRLYWAAGDRELGIEHARMSLEVLEDVGYIEHDEMHLPKLLGTYGKLGVGGGSVLDMGSEGARERR